MMFVVFKRTLQSSLILLDDLSSSSNETSSSSGNKTSFLTSGNISSNCGWVTNMLMVTTTMRMLNRVHCYTSNSRPVVSLSSSFEPWVGSLQERLIGSLSSSNNSNHSSAASKDGLSGSGWKSDSSFLTVIGVTNNDSWGSGSSSEGSSISHLTLAVGDNSSFWHRLDWKNITNREWSLGSGVNKLSSVHSFDSDEVLNSLLVSVCISEDNFCKWGSSTWVMNDILDNSLNVSFSLNVVESSESSWSNSVCGSRLENHTTTVSLSSDASTHD